LNGAGMAEQPIRIDIIQSENQTEALPEPPFAEMTLALRRTGLSSPAYQDWLDYVIVEDGRDMAVYLLSGMVTVTS
jgi:hypothetical protein